MKLNLLIFGSVVGLISILMSLAFSRGAMAIPQPLSLQDCKSVLPTFAFIGVNANLLTIVEAIEASVKGEKKIPNEFAKEFINRLLLVLVVTLFSLMIFVICVMLAGQDGYIVRLSDLVLAIVPIPLGILIYLYVSSFIERAQK